jgi:hypothetical protein
MSGEMKTLCLRLAELARMQRGALEAGDLDQVLELAGTRQQVLREIQKFDGSSDAVGTDGNPSAPASVLREILSIDRESEDIARAGLRDAAIKLGEINTFKVFCQGAVDEVRRGSAALKT